MALILVPTVIGLLATLLPTPQATIYLVASLIVETIFVVVLWLALRPRGADVRSRSELERAIHGGKPVIVELFSSFCLICMSIRQASQTAADILKEQATVVRVELRTTGGREIGDAYGVSYVPSYLLFDEHGDLVRKIVPDTVTPLANGYRVLDEGGKVVRRLVRIEPDSLVDIARKA
jgi:thiol-disulfide isomerase/thioredoxin